jgi:hypothetical protein
VHHTIRDGAGDEIATAEYPYLHVNRASGRVEPLPADRQAVVDEVLAAHATHPAIRR